MKKNPRPFILFFALALIFFLPGMRASATAHFANAGMILLNSYTEVDATVNYYDTNDGTMKFAIGDDSTGDCTFTPTSTNSNMISPEIPTPATDGVHPLKLSYDFKNLTLQTGKYCVGWFESNQESTKLGVNTFKPFTDDGYVAVEFSIQNDTDQETYQLASGYPSVSSSAPPAVQLSIVINKPTIGDNYQVVLGTSVVGGKCLQISTLAGFNHQSYKGSVSVGSTPSDVLSADQTVYTISDWWNQASGNALQPGTYCIGLNKQAPGGSWTTPAATVNLGSFTVPGAVVTPTAASTTPGPNAYGCTSNGTSSYCMLAPLPIPAADGSIDPSGKIDTTQGFGSYIGGIIKLVMGLITVLAVLMIVVGGIEYMSTVSIGEKEGAKDRIMNAIFGLLLALGSYVILYTINPNLVNVTVTIPGANLTLSENQGIEADETGTMSSSLPPVTGITVPTGSAQDLAKQILQNSKITLDGVWGQNDAASTPQQNIADTAAGNPASTSQAASSQLGGVKHVPLSASMLAGMLAVSEVSPITITAIEGSVHSGPSSKHYLGRAFDIQADHSDSPSSLPLDKSFGDACRTAGASLVITPCGGNYGSAICAATGYATNTGHETHVHCEWPS